MTRKILVLLSIFSIGLYSQGTNDDVELTLTKFKNYRFGNVNVYQVKDASIIGEIVKSNDPANQKTADTKEVDAIKSKYNPDAVLLIEQGVNEGALISDISANVLRSGYDPIEPSDMDILYAYYVSLAGPADNKITTAFIITLPPAVPAGKPTEIIGMVIKQTPFEEATDDLSENLEDVTTEEAYSYREMKLTEIDPATVTVGSNIDNLYDLAEVYFAQGNVKNRTLDARGITDDEIAWGDVEKGVSEPIISYNAPYEVQDYQIQTFKRISNGEPSDYIAKNMEVFVGPDKISWKKYPLDYMMDRKGNIELDSMGNPIIDDYYPTNSYLPDLGVELSYGIDAANLPSFTSERLSLNFIWRQLKFGLILPTGGWSSISNDIYGQTRTLTHGGFGFNFAADFDVPIINRSDVFHVDGAYVSSDANPADFLDNIYGNAIDELETNPGPGGEQAFFNIINGQDSYMVRANASAHYTFGMSIDKNNLLRFSLGGTVLNVERWNYGLIPADDGLLGSAKQESFQEIETTTVGGITTKIDFMAKGGQLPWGASIQYFDESFYSNIFAQFSVIENTLFIKVNALGRFDVKNERRAWESAPFLQPMINFIYIF